MDSRRPKRVFYNMWEIHGMTDEERAKVNIEIKERKDKQNKFDKNQTMKAEERKGMLCVCHILLGIILCLTNRYYLSLSTL